MWEKLRNKDMATQDPSLPSTTENIYDTTIIQHVFFLATPSSLLLAPIIFHPIKK